MSLEQAPTIPSQEKILIWKEKTAELFDEWIKLPEIAEALDGPTGTVRSRLARARTALQRTLWNVARDHGLQMSRAAGTHG